MIQRTEHSDRQDNYHPVNPDDPVKKNLSGYTKRMMREDFFETPKIS